MKLQNKTTILLVAGNILEYYDFLLFAHLGPIITPLFFPDLSLKQAHILGLLLFGLSFITRPIGGLIFGSISDRIGRKVALVKSMQWAMLPAFALAFLPTANEIGIVATYLFVIFRLLQGIALGGEYTNAGTYLMEYHQKRRGFISGILAASGTIGSIVGFGFAYLCLQPGTPPWLWRVAFFIGGVGGIISYVMRKMLAEIIHPEKVTYRTDLRWKQKVTMLLLIGALVSVSNWLPSTYSNFYVTKILEYPTNYGLVATFVALISYIIFTPMFGFLSDYVEHYKLMIWAAFICIPLSFISFSLLTKGYIVLAQIGLILCAASFGAPIHMVMNSIFRSSTRGRNISFFFVAGLSIGGMTPSVVGYIVDKTHSHYAAPLFASTVALLVGLYLVSMRNLYYSARKLDEPNNH